MTHRSEDYVEWTGTEEGIFHIVMWWNSKIYWDHSPDCERESLHCCEGVSEYVSLNTLQSTTTSGVWPSSVVLTFGDWQGNLEPMEVGDRIYYIGEGIFELRDSQGNRKDSRK